MHLHVPLAGFASRSRQALVVLIDLVRGADIAPSLAVDVRRRCPGHRTHRPDRGDIRGGPGSDPNSWQAERDRRIADMHQRLHDADAQGSAPQAGGTTSGSSAGTTGGPDRPA